jgi:hypothetical protein
MIKEPSDLVNRHPGKPDEVVHVDDCFSGRAISDARSRYNNDHSFRNLVMILRSMMDREMISFGTMRDAVEYADTIRRERQSGPMQKFIFDRIGAMPLLTRGNPNPVNNLSAGIIPPAPLAFQTSMTTEQIDGAAKEITELLRETPCVSIRADWDVALTEESLDAAKEYMRSAGAAAREHHEEALLKCLTQSTQNPATFCKCGWSGRVSDLIPGSHGEAVLTPICDTEAIPAKIPENQVDRLIAVGTNEGPLRDLTDDEDAKAALAAGPPVVLPTHNPYPYVVTFDGNNIELPATPEAMKQRLQEYGLGAPLQVAIDPQAIRERALSLYSTGKFSKEAAKAKAIEQLHSERAKRDKANAEKPGAKVMEAGQP